MRSPFFNLPPFSGNINRVFYRDPSAPRCIADLLLRYIEDLSKYQPFTDAVIVCIGTDRSTGDSLGPLTGTKISEFRLKNLTVYGSLEEPVHATNLTDKIEMIKKDKPYSLVLAVDACLGKSENIGYININKGPLKPGTGVNKDLPLIGDIHITGVVNVGGYMEYLVLQNTRLNLVMGMSNTIAEGIRRAFLSLESRLEESRMGKNMMEAFKR